MKKLILNELMIFSPTDKKAKIVKFDKKRTLIKGLNNTGKSSLIKSIYSTFGANPGKISDSWQRLNPYTFVKFEIEDHTFSLLRINNTYSLFDGNKELIGSYRSVTNELTPVLADLLDFKMQIASSNGKMIIPPTQYMFLPYYIDQDVSWSGSWNAFSGLQQLANWKPDLVNYFLGVTPNEYYDLKEKINEAENKKSKIDSEISLYIAAFEKIDQEEYHTNFDINMKDFKAEIERLLNKCQTLQTIQIQLKNKLVDYYNIRSTVVNQIEITRHAREELNKDYNFVREELLDDHVECPTCGAGYNNSFSERFNIAQDENTCQELLIDLDTELNEIDIKIKKEKDTYNENLSELEQISKILNSKKETVKLKDLLKIEGKKEIIKNIETHIKSLNLQVDDIKELLKKLKKELLKYVDKERKKENETKYLDHMQKYLYELNLTIDINAYKNIRGTIKSTGSGLPRALLAYYFSIFALMKENVSSAFCPIVLDSPNQQAQDSGNLKRMLNFIKEHQPENTQIIIGLEDNYDIDFNCPVVTLTNPYALLQNDDYNEVNRELSYYIDQVFK